MRKYEGMFIFAPSLEDEARNNLFEKFKGIIEENGSVDSVDEWGSRKLAYEINDITEGYYIVVNFKAEGSVIKELDRVSKITDGVIRHMVVNEDE